MVLSERQSQGTKVSSKDTCTKDSRPQVLDLQFFIV